VAQALLAAVAGLCGQGVSARITEAWSEPVILWQALVGGPSSDANSHRVDTAIAPSPWEPSLPLRVALG
jgi:hypothetical protein